MSQTSVDFRGLLMSTLRQRLEFGDSVGAALLNPTVNGTLASLTSEVQNALIDEAEGLTKVIGNPEGRYKVGIALISEPPYLPLQGEAFSISPSESTIDRETQVGAGSYARFDGPARTDNLTIENAPSTFTLNTQHYGGMKNVATLRRSARSLRGEPRRVIASRCHASRLARASA